MRLGCEKLRLFVAAKPIERYVKRQIADQGGWPRILERLRSGETVADISRTILRSPTGPCISRSFLSILLHQDPARSALVKDARREGASAMVDDALHIVDSAPVDRDSVNKAKVRAELRVKVAGFIDREQWGEKKQEVNVQVNMADIHLDSLRHRMIEASRPLAEALHQVLPLRQLTATAGSETAGEQSSHVCETQCRNTTQELAVQIARDGKDRPLVLQEVAPSEKPV